MTERILIIGADTGIGKELAYEALKAETKKVVLHFTRTHRYKIDLPP